jgi:hypothetical protein
LASLPLPLALAFGFFHGSYSYPSTQARDHLINAIGGRGTWGGPI